MTEISFSFRFATKADAPKVVALVDAAYGQYVERIGMLPHPMTDDYTEVIENRRVTVAESEETIVGVIVLFIDSDGFFVDNVAAPSRRGEGPGKALLKLTEAEARHAGFDSIHLYTQEDDEEPSDLFAARIRQLRSTFPGQSYPDVYGEASGMTLPCNPALCRSSPLWPCVSEVYYGAL